MSIDDAVTTAIVSRREWLYRSIDSADLSSLMSTVNRLVVCKQ